MNKYQEAFEDLCITWDEEGMGKDHFKDQYPYLYNTIKELVDREAKYKMAYDILKRIVNYGYIDPEYGIFDSNIDLSEEEEEYVISLIDKENK